MTIIWNIWSEFPRAFTQDGLGSKKTLFFETDFELWPNIISATEHDIHNQIKFVNLQGLPGMPTP